MHASLELKIPQFLTDFQNAYQPKYCKIPTGYQCLKSVTKQVTVPRHAWCIISQLVGNQATRFWQLDFNNLNGSASPEYNLG